MKLQWLLLAVALIPFSYALDYSDGIHFITPGLELDEKFVLSSSSTLVFYSCMEGSITNNSIRCSGAPAMDLGGNEWNETCTISSVDLEALRCRNLTITAEYGGNSPGVLSQEVIAMHTLSVEDLLNSYAASDGYWGSTKETALAVRMLSGYSDFRKDMEKSITWLTQSRNNQYKCWPKDECSIRETALMLSFLGSAGTNRTARLVHDSRVWLAERENYIFDSAWNAEMTTDDDTNCSFTYDSISDEFNLLENGTTRYEITATYGKRFRLECDDDADFYLRDHENKTVFYETGSEDIEFVLDGPCWSLEGKWKPCNSQATLYAITGLDSDFLNYDELRDWLDSELTTYGSRQYMDTSKEITDTAFFVSGAEPKDEVVEWLLYSQNNDGSWGTGTIENNILPTLYSIDAVRNIPDDSKHKDHSSINLEQAYEWLMDVDSPYGFHDAETDIMYHHVLTEAFNEQTGVCPSLLLIEKNTVIRIGKEYDRNTKAALSESLDDILETEISNGMLRISVGNISDGYYYGMLALDGGVDCDIPIILTKTPWIKISYPKKVTVYGSIAKLVIDVNKSDSILECQLRFPGIVSDKMTIGNETNVKAYLNLGGKFRSTKTYHGNLTCSHQQIEIPVSIEIDQYPDKPFAFTPKIVKITEAAKSAYLNITNNLNETISVNLSLQNEYLSVEKEIVLGANKEERLEIKSTIPEGLNISMNESILLQSGGQAEKVMIEATVIAVEPSILDTIIQLSIPALGLLALGGLVYFAYTKRSMLIPKKKPTTKDQKASSAPVNATEAKTEMKKSVDPYLIKVARRLNELLKRDEKELDEKLKAMGLK